MTDIRTVRDAIRWINKLKQLDCEGSQVMMVQALISGEREACAKLADQMRIYWGDDGARHGAYLIADAIRARGK